jgi:hypothetical protein
MSDTSVEPRDWTGKACPKCGYVRTAADTNPAWQCPQCQIAYIKYGAPAPVHTLLALHGRGMVEHASSDHSLLWLLIANAVALGIALHFRMSLRDLMLVYWIQSVVIGVTHAIRILSLDRFSASGVYLEGRALPDTIGSRIRAAGFFWVHYGAIHSVYFLVIAFLEQGGPLSSIGTYLLCTLVFVLNHAVSLRHNLERDARGRPNIGILMFMPYARVVPMQAVFFSGVYFSGGGSSGLLLFGVLKTAADAAMHLAEHYLMARRAGDEEEAWR